MTHLGRPRAAGARRSHRCAQGAGPRCPQCMTCVWLSASLPKPSFFRPWTDRFVCFTFNSILPDSLYRRAYSVCVRPAELGSVGPLAAGPLALVRWSGCSRPCRPCTGGRRAPAQHQHGDVSHEGGKFACQGPDVSNVETQPAVLVLWICRKRFGTGVLLLSV